MYGYCFREFWPDYERCSSLCQALIIHLFFLQGNEHKDWEHQEPCIGQDDVIQQSSFYFSMVLLTYKQMVTPGEVFPSPFQNSQQWSSPWSGGVGRRTWRRRFSTVLWTCPQGEKWTDSLIYHHDNCSWCFSTIDLPTWGTMGHKYGSLVTNIDFPSIKHA